MRNFVVKPPGFAGSSSGFQKFESFFQQKKGEKNRYEYSNDFLALKLDYPSKLQ